MRQHEILDVRFEHRGAGGQGPELRVSRAINLAPGAGFEEIATLTPSGDVPARTPDQFKAVVRADVCRVGGDVVVTEVNGLGEYVRGTVLRAQAAAASGSSS